ncbi:Methyltransferase domain-containing protein [Limimonas halophila]|uniref:Methyltransferase domain-containing protein n=1 Tax=Limimonas halophila TaxID=1082479 RepID=A0A1G7SKQ1_9PROT|nr:class I SAM-dependent methyltransferase [Limimonas halophila]SDG22810.1 Methyltransferase domain-containing protein [Limimonas halophila]
MPEFDDAASFWDAKYADERYHFGTEPNAFLAREAWRLLSGARVLAVADGEGRNGVWLAERGMDVVSVDVSPRATAKARALAGARGVSPEIHNAAVETFDMGEAAFDAVVAIFIQFAPPGTREDLFRRMVRALKPGGLLFLHGYRPEQVDYGTGGPPYPEHMYTEALLREQFAGLEWLHFAAYDAEVREGPGHAGLSALIELVARKPGDA